jgi:hypothetical protein
VFQVTLSELLAHDMATQPRQRKPFLQAESGGNPGSEPHQKESEAYELKAGLAAGFAAGVFAFSLRRLT